MNPEAFKIDVSQSTLDDLRERLLHTRWPDEVAGADWDYGTSQTYLKALVDYWCEGFNWRQQEMELNRFAHFRVQIDDYNIHFIHQRGVGPNPIPLILTHGWPDSFYRMYKIIPMLTDPASFGADPADSFDVIVPSLPGFGFSSVPPRRGVTSAHVADLWARLMIDHLGYRRFGAHGGDLGRSVTISLAKLHPEALTGIHITDVPPPRFSLVNDKLANRSEAEQAFLTRGREWEREEGAYARIQSTRPQTLAYGLNDSPAGLAAWIIEKFRAWSDCDGDPEEAFTRDELLTNLTLYWVTETINSSFRLYYESAHTPPSSDSEDRVSVPTAFAMFPKDLIPAPREWAERFFNVERWTEMPRGGHFAALEVPELLVEDIRAFYRQWR